MSGKVKVSSETLRTKAGEVDVALPTLPPGPQAPSALKISQDATNLIAGAGAGQRQPAGRRSGSGGPQMRPQRAR